MLKKDKRPTTARLNTLEWKRCLALKYTTEYIKAEIRRNCMSMLNQMYNNQ